MSVCVGVGGEGGLVCGSVSGYVSMRACVCVCVWVWVDACLCMCLCVGGCVLVCGSV